MSALQKEIEKWEVMTQSGISENEYFLSSSGIKTPYMFSYLCESSNKDCNICPMFGKFKNEDRLTYSKYCHTYGTVYRNTIGKALQSRTKLTKIIKVKGGNDILDDTDYRIELQRVNKLFLENLKEV